MKDLSEMLRKAQALKSSGVLTMKELAEEMGVSERTVYRWFSKPKYDPIKYIADKKWQLTGDWMIAGDFHLGATDYEYVMELIRTAKRLNIKRLLIAGDLFNFAKVSRHPKVYSEMPLKDEIPEGRKLMEILFTWFEQINWFIGNHDAWFLAWMEGDFTIKDLAHLICPDGYAEKFNVSDYNSCYIRANGRKWLILHANEYNKSSLVIGRKYADARQCHVIQHHQHLSAEGLSTNGRWIVVDNGCMCLQRQLNYAEKEENLMPSMSRGFVALVNGYHTRFYLENPPTPDDEEA